jgi:STAM-binding protein
MPLFPLQEQLLSCWRSCQHIEITRSFSMHRSARILYWYVSCSFKCCDQKDLRIFPFFSFHWRLTDAYMFGQNGHDILDNLSNLKPILLRNYEQWEKQHHNDLDNDRTPDAVYENLHGEDHYEQEYSTPQSDHRYDGNRVRGRERAREKERSAREYEREMQEELQRWKEQGEDIRREEEEYRTGSRASSRRRDAAVTAGYAAGRPENTDTFSHPPSHASYAPQGPRPAPDPPRLQEEHIGQQQQQEISSHHHQEEINSHHQQGINSQQQQQEISRHQQQQEEFRRREEEIIRKREQRRREEQHGIAQRQREAEQEAQTVRQIIAANNSGTTVPTTSSSASNSTMTHPTSTSSSSASTPSSSFYHTQTPTQAAYPDLRAPRAVKSRPPSFMGTENLPVPSVTPLPLESPGRYEGDSTDSESRNNHSNEWRRKQKHAIDYSKASISTPTRRCVFLYHVFVLY